MSTPAGVMQTTYCPYCSVQLSYPQGSMFIQCPKCRNTMNPQAPQHTPCHNCGTLLAHPANSICIQCPKCLFAMNARERPLQPTQTIPNTYHHYVPTAQSSAFLGKTKKRKDPNAPKASSNAYMIFCKERRAKLKEDHPELPFGKLGAKLGEIWRNMPQEAKRPFEERAAMDRERYRRQMQEYALHSPHLKSEDAVIASATDSSIAGLHAKIAPNSPASLPPEFSSPSFSAPASMASMASGFHLPSGGGSMGHGNSAGGGNDLSPFLNHQSHPSQGQLHHHPNNIPSPVQSTFLTGTGVTPPLMGAPAVASSGGQGLSPAGGVSMMPSSGLSATAFSSAALAPSSSSTGTPAMFPGTASLSLPPSTVQKLQDNADMSNFMQTLRMLTGNNSLTLSSLLSNHSAPSSTAPSASPPPAGAAPNSTHPTSITTSTTASHSLSLFTSSPLDSSIASGGGGGSLLTPGGASSALTTSTITPNAASGSAAHVLNGIVGVSPPTIVTHALPFGSASPLPPTTASSTSVMFSPFPGLHTPSSSTNSFSVHSHDFTSHHHSASAPSLSTSDLISNQSFSSRLSPSVVGLNIQPPDPTLLAMANQAASITPSLHANANNSSSSAASLNSNGASNNSSNNFHGAVSMELDELSSAPQGTGGGGDNGNNESHMLYSTTTHTNGSHHTHVHSTLTSNSISNSNTSSAMLIDSHDIPRVQSDTSIGSYGSLGLMDSTSDLTCRATGAAIPPSPPSSSETNGNNVQLSPVPSSDAHSRQTTPATPASVASPAASTTVPPNKFASSTAGATSSDSHTQQTSLESAVSRHLPHN